MLSRFKGFFSALFAAALLATLVAGARADDPAITLEPGAAMRARIDSAVARAATGGNFSIVEINGDFARFRARVNSLITFLERRLDEQKRRIVSLGAERDIKQRTLKGQQDRLNTLTARMQSGGCGSEEMKSLKQYTDDLVTETNTFKDAATQIDAELAELDKSTSQAGHDVRFLTPLSLVSENSRGMERPIIDRLTLKNGNAVYFDGTMNVERDILDALREAHDGFAANIVAAQATVERHRGIMAEYTQARNELGDIGTQKQHVLLEKLAVIDDSYEAWMRAGVNAGLDGLECYVEGKGPIGGLVVAISKATEAVAVYTLTGQQAWSNFDVDKLEAHYQINKDVNVDPAWLMFSARSYLLQQLSKTPSTVPWAGGTASREAEEATIKASLAALNKNERAALAALEEEGFRKVEKLLNERGLEAAKAAFMAEAGKPTRAQLLRSIYAEITRLRGANSEAAQAALQAAKIAYMREISNVTDDAISAVKMRQLYEIVNEQRAAVRAADEALAQSSEALRQLKKAGEETRDTISKINIRQLIKDPEALKKILKKGGIGLLRGLAWDALRSGAQSALDEYYGGHWIDFYKAYMDVEAVIHDLKALNARWKIDYDNLYNAGKELSDAIVLRDTCERFYDRYLSKLQGTEGLHVAINEVPRTATGDFLVEVKSKGAHYGHMLRLRGDAGEVDLEPATPLPSYNAISDTEVREAVEQTGRSDTFTYKTPDGFELRNICRAAAAQASAGGKCNLHLTVYYK